MQSPGDNAQLLCVLKSLVKRDKVKTTVVDMTPLGLVEINLFVFRSVVLEIAFGLHKGDVGGCIGNGDGCKGRGQNLFDFFDFQSGFFILFEKVGEFIKGVWKSHGIDKI